MTVKYKGSTTHSDLNTQQTSHCITMTAYNFLRESNVHLVYGGSRYLLKTTPDVSFSQTFAEDAYEVKTLHDQTKMFQGTSITKANPANFSFTVHLTTEKDETIVKSLLTDYDATEGKQD